MDLYLPPQPMLWHGRDDTPNKERYFQQIICTPFNDIDWVNLPPSVFIIGFKSDLGIQRNHGRIGASEGPEYLRQFLGKLPKHTPTNIIDIGDIYVKDDLEKAQKNLGELVEKCHEYGHRTLVFGGGHEVAYGHFLGLSRRFQDIGIINIDAHFDIRPLDKDGLGTSGTPFTQIYEKCHDESRHFSYLCIGIQPYSNTPFLFNRASKMNVNYITASHLHHATLPWSLPELDAFLRYHKNIYLTVCMDAVAECFAPGVSAPNPLGLTPVQLEWLMKIILKSNKVIGMDIAEYSPPLDEQGKTGRLAAILASMYL